MLKVMISSTSIDLLPERAKVKDAIERLDMHAIAMEEFNATTRNALQLCYDKVQEADILVGIYAHRYGFAPDASMTYKTVTGDTRTGDGKTSITHWEYQWAIERGIPVLLFVLDRDVAWKPAWIEGEPGASGLKAFLAEVGGKHVFSKFNSPDNLQALVSPALSAAKAEIEAKTSPPAPSSDPIGRVKPIKAARNYTLRKIIGTGGMAEIWEAEEITNAGSRLVAYKRLLATFGERNRQRFKEEMNALKRFSHPHIVPVYDSDDVDGQLYLTMPLMTNGTVADWLKTHPGAVSQERAFRWLDQVAAALDYAHKNQIVAHRDVKPANILLYEDDEDVALADFGIARSNAATEITDSGVIIGSRPYMAPEQFEEEPVNRQTDIYALGIVAYELLTGHRPYVGEPAELRRQHLTAKLPDDRALMPQMLDVLRIATARHPEDRYPTARSFVNALREAAAGVKPETLDTLTQAYLEQMLLDITQEARDQIKKNMREMYVGQTGTISHLAAPPEVKPIGRYDTNARILERKKQRQAFLSAGRVTLDARHCTPEMSETQAEAVPDVRVKLLQVARGVLLGEPGTGKTFTLKQLFIDYADAWLEADPEQRAKQPIPVFVPLREYNGLDANRQPLSFADFVAEQLGVLKRHRERLLRDKRLMFLCDALNEMPRGNADQNVQAVQTYLQDKPRYLVSCRVRDYRGDDLAPLKPLEQVYLQELDLPRIKELILKRLPELGAALWLQIGGTPTLERFWEAVVLAKRIPNFWDAQTDWGYMGQKIGDYEERQAWREINRGARLIPLCRNPFMAFLLCSLYEKEQGDLPKSRAALFGDFALTLLIREEDNAEAVGKTWAEDGLDRIQAALVTIANAMQTARGTVLSRRDALSMIEATDAAWIIDSAIAASILVQEGEGENAALRFTHQLLQEYFACQVLLEALESDEANGTDTAERFFQENGGEGWWDAGVWRETTVILGEFLGERERGPNRVARWLAPASPEAALEVILRNGEGLTVADVESETRQALLESAKNKLNAPDPRGRASAWRVLGKLDADDRPGVLDFDFKVGEYWCPVPAGVYPLGSDEDSDNPKHEATLSAFYIAKYPITYQQFQAFVEDEENGYKNAQWWHDLHPQGQEQQAKQGVGDQEFKIWNHPRERVSWYDAMAFCRWLSAKLGYEVRLPTEDEWEAATRGKDERRYPYVGEYDPAKGNTGDTGIRQTSAVGIFPEGVSPVGALDMSGNVWEWTLDEYGTRSSNDVTNNKSRAWRGGSWYYDADYARAAYRPYGDPASRDDSVGFRVVCSAPVE